MYTQLPTWLSLWNNRVRLEGLAGANLVDGADLEHIASACLQVFHLHLGLLGVHLTQLFEVATILRHVDSIGRDGRSAIILGRQPVQGEGSLLDVREADGTCRH